MEFISLLGLFLSIMATIIMANVFTCVIVVWLLRKTDIQDEVADWSMAYTRRQMERFENEL